MSGVSQISQLIIQHDLTSIAGEIRSVFQEGIRLFDSSSNPAAIEPGSSRLGGLPDTPAGFSWPAWHNVPMAFIAQIHLADLASFTPARPLPKDGLLAFFYDAKQETYGASPQDRGGWSVVYFPGTAKLQQAKPPVDLPKEALYKPRAIQFRSVWTFPASLTQVLPDLKLSDAQQKQYEALLDDYAKTQDRSQPQHQMFGWPVQLQDDMQLQSAMMSQGITEMNDPREAAAERQKLNWQLLLQVDSDDSTGMRWGSNGLIDYWSEDQDLKNHQFDSTWLVLQSE